MCPSHPPFRGSNPPARGSEAQRLSRVKDGQQETKGGGSPKGLRGRGAEDRSPPRKVWGGPREEGVSTISRPILILWRGEGNLFGNKYEESTNSKYRKFPRIYGFTHPQPGKIKKNLIQKHLFPQCLYKHWTLEGARGHNDEHTSWPLEPSSVQVWQCMVKIYLCGFFIFIFAFSIRYYLYFSASEACNNSLQMQGTVCTLDCGCNKTGRT